MKGPKRFSEKVLNKSTEIIEHLFIVNWTY